MGISLLWLRDLSLVSGKLNNVEVKEILYPTCLATTELSNTNKAHCLFKGERRSVRLKSDSAVIFGLLLSILLLIHSSVGCWELVCWPKPTEKRMIYGKLPSHALPHGCLFPALRNLIFILFAESTHRGLSAQHIPAEKGGHGVAVCYVMSSLLLWWTWMDP